MVRRHRRYYFNFRGIRRNRFRVDRESTLKQIFTRLSLTTILFVALSSCDVINNFHEVDSGKLYRSGQMSGEDLAKKVEEFHIKTVINLRGSNPTEKWWQEEYEVARKYGLAFINIPMSASRLPNRRDLIELLDAYRSAPRPILIHCQGGADRTGEAAAIYQMIYMGKSKDEALDMLSLKYAHIEKSKPAKIYFIKNVWEDERWAYKQYDPCNGQYQYYSKDEPACSGQSPIDHPPGNDPNDPDDT